MHIRFGLHLDGERGWHAKNRLGEITVGPLGMLNILETQLGLLHNASSQSVRIVQYRECLKRIDHPKRFYHRSFAADELGTAANLLAWRDLWHLHGWDGSLKMASSQRLLDIHAVEAITKSVLAPSLGERLEAVAIALSRRNVPIERLELTDPFDTFPARWQEIARLLSFEASDDGGVAQGQGFLGKLQRALIELRSGNSPTKLKWKSDGTVTVVQSETGLTAGHWFAGRCRKLQDDGLIVAQVDGGLLDDILYSCDFAREGFAESSAFRPALQVLPLALEIIWEPLNCYGLLQFLTLSLCPIPSYARRKLADKMADAPGIGGRQWLKVIADIEEHYGARRKDIRKSINYWVEHPRYDQKMGAPIDALLDRARAVGRFFKDRLGEGDTAQNFALNAGFAQASACAEALFGLREQGVVSLLPQQLHKLLTQTTARGSENPMLVAQAGALAAVGDPAAVIEPFEHVLWWQLAAPPMPPAYPWSQTELLDLAAATCALPSMSSVLEQTAEDWLRPILAARKSLTLVLPSKGAEHHPVWLMVTALVENIQVVALEGLLTEKPSGTELIGVKHQKLPERRRWWKLPAGVKMAVGDHASFSSLEPFLFNPYQWVLAYPAALTPSRILSIRDDFFLRGDLAHAIIDDLCKMPNALDMSKSAFAKWFETTFNRVIAEQGAIFLQPGRRADLETFREALHQAIRQLRQHLAEGAVVQAVSETGLVGSYIGGELRGYADLVTTNKKGNRAIVDLKWSGPQKYSKKLRDNSHLQLAIYAELIRQQTAAWPDVAYFVLDTGRLLTLDANYFPNAQVVRKATEEGTADLWQRFQQTWKWRKAQIDSGVIELVLESVEKTEESEPPESGLELEALDERYNSYLALAGWEA